MLVQNYRSAYHDSVFGMVRSFKTGTGISELQRLQNLRDMLIDQHGCRANDE